MKNKSCKVALAVVFAFLTVLLRGPFVQAQNQPSDSTPVKNPEIVRKVQPRVVNIQTDRNYYIRNWGRDDFWLRFWMEFGEKDYKAENRLIFHGEGTGVIVDPSGLVLTNAHVVESAGNVLVLLHDKRKFTARLLGSNIKEDVALLQMETGESFPVIEFGDSDQVKQGEDVLAIGSPYGYSQSVSRGIVSATRREIKEGNKVIYKDMIQTDAAINPGNSGGPLLNTQGQMIGLINSADWRSDNIGFAIPVNHVRDLLPGLKTQAEKNAHLAEFHKKFGFLPQVSRNEDGFDELLVVNVTPRSAAEKAGLKMGDVLLSFNKKTFASVEDLREAALSIPGGVNVHMTIARNNRTFFTYLKAQ